MLDSLSLIVSFSSQKITRRIMDMLLSQIEKGSVAILAVRQIKKKLFLYFLNVDSTSVTI